MGTNNNKPGRQEPTLGDLDRLDAPAPRAADNGVPRVDLMADERRATKARRSGPPPHRVPPAWRSWLWPLLAILIVVLLALAWVNQDKLRAMMPRTHINTLLVEANQALAAGHLEGGKDSAHALYAEVLKDEPDNGHALHGLREVGTAELTRATTAIDAGDFAKAAISIDHARQLLGGGAAVTKVAKALAKAKHPVERMHATIARAQQALRAGKVSGSDGAAALYRQVLKVHPDNAVARHGLDRAGDMLAQEARAAMQSGHLDTAGKLIDELAQLSPHDGDLPALHAQLAQAKQAKQALATAIQTHLAKGQSDLRQGSFTGHDGANALNEFQQVLKLDPGNAQATAGLKQVARALVLRANAALDMNDDASAARLLEQAATLDPDSAELAMARSRLPADAMATTPAGTSANSQATTQVLPRVDTDAAMLHPTLSPLETVEVGHLLRQAKTAADAGHIMLPPGASAYDLYRQVLTIDANNKTARAGLDALSAKVAGAIKRALAAHHLTKAGNDLVTLQSLEPGSAQGDDLSKQLAAAWLDRAQNDLDAGNRQAAKKALAAAAKLDSDSTRFKALKQRLNND